jgi:hypothetical protein
MATISQNIRRHKPEEHDINLLWFTERGYKCPAVASVSTAIIGE